MLNVPIEDILKAIRENKDFRKDFVTKADSIVDKIYIFYSNPSSKSKEEIIEWINNNNGVINELLKKHDIVPKPIEPQPNDKVETQQIIVTPLMQVKPSNASKIGKIVKIDRNEKAYQELIETSINEKWVYRGCTITPEIVDNKAIWFVFFY